MAQTWDSTVVGNFNALLAMSLVKFVFVKEDYLAVKMRERIQQDFVFFAEPMVNYIVFFVVY
jgi:hypothetical protein